MERPVRAGDHRWLGDKRSQVVYDLDRLTADEAGIVDDIMASDASLVFGPDTLAEARNRGYREYKRYAE